VSRSWRARSTEYTFVANQVVAYRPFYEATRAALPSAPAAHGVDLPGIEHDEVLAVHHELDVSDDVPEGIERMPSEGTAYGGSDASAVSNGEPGTLAAMVERAGVGDPLVDTARADEVGTFEPTRSRTATPRRRVEAPAPRRPGMSDSDLVTVDDVAAAAERLADVVKRTPTDTSTTLARLSGADAVHLKLETLQRTGSFKIRGASNRLRTMDDAALARGVVAASGGNHAQGVALAARAAGAEATIVMPEVTPAAKVEATRGYGAEVVVHGAVYQESYERALALREERGATFVHPFDDPAVIAGQGTLGLELVEDVPDVDTVLVAVGGGGLISGVATAVAAHVPSARVVGVQTEGCAHMAAAMARGEPYEREGVDTVAEGIGASRTEELTLRHVRERVDEVVTVTDGETCEAMALLAERAKLVTEPAGAVAVAALLSDAVDVDVAGETVAVPVCGANVDLTTFAEHTRAGLARLGRYGTLRVAVPDWPASLSALADAVSTAGGSVDELARAPPAPDVPPNRTAVSVSVEGSGPDHLARVADAVDALDRTTVLERPVSGE
jgi:threonine dehydratase